MSVVLIALISLNLPSLYLLQNTEKTGNQTVGIPEGSSQTWFTNETTTTSRPKDGNSTDRPALGDNGVKESVDFSGSTDSTRATSVPLVPLMLPLPDQVQNDVNVTARNCSKNLCARQLCPRGQVCNLTLQCKTKCVLRKPVILNPATTESTLRPVHERSCPESPDLVCVHGVPENCSDGISCLCDSNWTGTLCTQFCNLTCVHGYCNLDGNNEMFCSCGFKYEGDTCDTLIPDKHVIFSNLREHARVLAASLSTALVVAIISSVIVIVVMWRMRALLVLQFIYIFKSYEDDDGKTYDAYVSMTSTPVAESFVYSYLLPNLENKGFKLYLPARDTPVGEVMSEAILAALENSRRTIMIVTSDYITNEWNRFEYLIAQHETLKLKQRIIPVILEDVQQEKKNMDRSLKHILDSIRCLKYPQYDQELTHLDAANFSDSIQSPDSNGSAVSMTPLNRTDRSYSTDSGGQTKYEKKMKKFWKRLELTMPKKKSQEKDPIVFLRSGSYDLQNEKSSSYDLQNEKNHL